MSKQREVVENKPTLTVFAGPNGSGKTTLVEDFSHEADLSIVVNSDAIGARLAQKSGQLQANSDQQLQAAIEAEAYPATSRWRMRSQDRSWPWISRVFRTPWPEHRPAAVRWCWTNWRWRATWWRLVIRPSGRGMLAHS
jgi:hypothetical protein